MKKIKTMDIFTLTKLQRKSVSHILPGKWMYINKKTGHISQEMMQLLERDGKWERIDVYIDFKKIAIGIKKNNKEGMLKISTKKGFSSENIAKKTLIGRYQFQEKIANDIYMFIYEPESGKEVNK